jgi:hypothetical protein
VTGPLRQPAPRSGAKRHSDALLKQLLQEVYTDAAGTIDKGEEHLVLGICGAGETCCSPACIAAHGLYPGLGVLADGVNLHLQHADDHDKAAGGRAVIVSMGEVAP